LITNDTLLFTNGNYIYRVHSLSLNLNNNKTLKSLILFFYHYNFQIDSIVVDVLLRRPLFQSRDNKKLTKRQTATSLMQELLLMQVRDNEGERVFTINGLK